MSDSELESKVRELTETNARLKATLDEIREQITPYIPKHPPTQNRTYEQQLLHDLRNVLNELGLLRALVPGDEETN